MASATQTSISAIPLQVLSTPCHTWLCPEKKVSASLSVAIFHALNSATPLQLLSIPSLFMSLATGEGWRLFVATSHRERDTQQSIVNGDVKLIKTSVAKGPFAVLERENGFYLETLNLFVEMVNLGKCCQDNYTYPFVFKAIGEEKLVDFGAAVHGIILMYGFEKDSFVMNSLLTMFMNCGKKEEGGKVFNSTWEPNVVSWNSMISGYIKNGCAKEALGFLTRWWMIRWKWIVHCGFGFTSLWIFEGLGGG
ncbi:hypothetical protein CRYUN_Cryun22dG0034300 [Craigia yunnanensis]